MNADPESQSLIAQLLVLFLLTLVNAFFAAAEIAVVSVNKNRVEQKAEAGDDSAKKLLYILENPTNFLSTIQIGITLINILLGALLANSLASKLALLFGGSIVAKNISTVLILMLLTYISIVFGELYPKRIAMNKSEEVAQMTSALIRILSVIVRPFIWLSSISTDLIAKMTPMEFDDTDEKMTRDEMRYLLEAEGVLDNDELEMLQGVFSLDTKVAREVMVPRTDAFMIDIKDDTQENITAILAENFSRIPVYNDDKDKIVGVLHTKNLLKSAHQLGFESIELRKLLQEPLFVPETIFIDDLLYELKRTQNQMAILLDEYGGVVGIATLEDLLEEIVGEIDDETDEVDKLYTKISEREYLLQGRMLIEEFNELFNMNLQMSDVDTMAGYLITALGLIPDEGQKLSFTIENLTLISEEVEGTRLLALKARFSEKSELLELTEDFE